MKYIVKYVSCVFLCTLFISLMGVFCAFGATFRYDGSLIEVEDPYYDEKDLLILIDNDTIIVPEEKYNEWRHADGYLMQVFWDKEGISELVDALSEKYVVYGNTSFITHDGYEVDLGDQAVEKRLDRESLERDINTALSIGSQKLVKAYVSKVNGENVQTYVEISIDEQKVFFYENGVQILSSSCVTGNESKGRSTSVGVYSINEMIQGKTLEGDDESGHYSNWVDYWMPFNGGQGLHDASWRWEFGGDIYKTAGSHGCVNLPKEFAKQLFEHAFVGCPVYVYDLSGVREPKSDWSSNYITDNGDLVITIEDSYNMG